MIYFNAQTLGQYYIQLTTTSFDFREHPITRYNLSVEVDTSTGSASIKTVTACRQYSYNIHEQHIGGYYCY